MLEGLKASRIERFILELEAEGSKDEGSKDSYLNLGLKAGRIERFIELWIV